MLIRLAAFAAAFLVATAAGATEFTDPVPSHPDQTYADLAASFVEGFALGDDGGATADIATPIRYVDEAETTATEADSPGPVTVSAVHATIIHSGGRPFIAVSVDLGETGDWPMVILGVFDPDLRLVDKARIDLDRFVHIDDPLPLSEGDDGLVVRSSHFNAGENYESTELVYLANGTLTALPSLGAYSVFSCEYQDTAAGTFTAPDDGSPGFRPVTATLRFEHTLMPDCPSFTAPYDDGDPAEEPLRIEAPWRKSATATYVWSASLGLYVEQSNDIDALIREVSWYDDGEE